MCFVTLQIHSRHYDKCDLHDVQDEKHVPFLSPCLDMCYLRRKCASRLADFTGTDRINVGDTEVLDIFCLAGSAQHAQQSTHLAEDLNSL